MSQNRVKMTQMQLISNLHSIIPRIGKPAKADVIAVCGYINMGMWSSDDVKEWATNFVEDPWRVQNKQYCTVGHFLREPDKWAESKKINEEKLI